MPGSRVPRNSLVVRLKMPASKPVRCNSLLVKFRLPTSKPVARNPPKIVETEPAEITIETKPQGVNFQLPLNNTKASVAIAKPSHKENQLKTVEADCSSVSKPHTVKFQLLLNNTKTSIAKEDPLKAVNKAKTSVAKENLLDAVVNKGMCSILCHLNHHHQQLPVGVRQNMSLNYPSFEAPSKRLTLYFSAITPREAPGRKRCNETESLSPGDGD